MYLVSLVRTTTTDDDNSNGNSDGRSDYNGNDHIGHTGKVVPLAQENKRSDPKSRMSSIEK